jgi:hypothetical protein
MLTTRAAIVDPAADAHAIGHRRNASRSLVDRDEFGPITGRPAGLFTAATVPLAVEPPDELRQRIAAWVPDADLL